MIDVLRPYFEPLGYLFGLFGKLSSMPWAEFCAFVGGYIPLTVPNVFSASTVAFPSVRTLADKFLLNLTSNSRFWGVVVTPLIGAVKNMLSFLGDLLATVVPEVFWGVPCIIVFAVVAIWLILCVKLIKLILSFIPFF